MISCLHDCGQVVLAGQAAAAAAAAAAYASASAIDCLRRVVPAPPEPGYEPLYEADVDLSGLLADWNAHLSLVRDKAAPLPEPLAAPLVEIAEQLTATTADAPMAALRAAGVLERIAARITREAAGAVSDEGVCAETADTGLGTTCSKA
ncbi:hypothetical protein [Streptomyces vinaceus]|uniref:hypothetical protein n=1 Tax=Streptomyces vinaceus TaxID=1960 RepID=UPI0036815A4A